jgi:hypothetical protein
MPTNSLTSAPELEYRDLPMQHRARMALYAWAELCLDLEAAAEKCERIREIIDSGPMGNGISDTDTHLLNETDHMRYVINLFRSSLETNAPPDVCRILANDRGEEEAPDAPVLIEQP